MGQESAAPVVEDPADLGLEVLAQIVERMPDAVTLFDEQRRRVYVNPAVCELLGRSQQLLLGSDYLEQMPPEALPLASAGYSAFLEAGGTDLVVNTVIGAGGAEREVMFAVHRVHVGGRPHLASVSRDLTAPRATVRAAAALAHTAADLVGTASTNDILIDIARHAVEHTRGAAARILTVDDDHVDFGGGYGPGSYMWRLETSIAVQTLRTASAELLLTTMTGGAIVPGDVPGRPIVLADAGAVWRHHPLMDDFVASMTQADLQAVLVVPLAYDNRVTGVLMVYFEAGVVTVDDLEVAFCESLADHAMVAVATSHVTQQIAELAATRERNRLAHELHDSVSQSLFAMTLHARAAQLAMRAAGREADSPLGRSVEQLAQLTHEALAEMRTLVTELRPLDLAREGLVRALTTRADLVSAREPVTVTVDGPSERLQLDATTEAHVFRIVAEALHNVVKHARARHASVVVRQDSDHLRIEVADDGVGFNTSSAVNGLGLTTMAQRATAIGADFSVIGERGCTVSLLVPLTGRPGKRAPGHG